MRYILILTLLILSTNLGNSQKLDFEYRTVIDENRFHYIIFTKENLCIVKVPYKNHSEAMLGGRSTEFILKYQNLNDTITFCNSDSIAVNPKIIERLSNAILISENSGNLYDLNSGYTYFKRRKSIEPGRSLVFVINDKVFKMKLPKIDGYGLVKHSKKPNSKLTRTLRKLDEDKIRTDTISGFDAFKLYGLVGANGVIKIEEVE